MTLINQSLFSDLLRQAAVTERKRINYDLRTNAEDGGQRMLNALMPETIVPIHRHPNSNETVLLLQGKLYEVLFDDDGKEMERILLDVTQGNMGCVVLQGVWHTVEVIEPSIIYEAKDGRYGEDGSESWKNL